MDHIFKESGRTLTQDEEYFDINIWVPEEHWASFINIPPKEMRKIDPSFAIGRVTLPGMVIVCETVLFRWCRMIFGEDTPFQPLIVECLSLKLVKDESVTKVVAVCGGKNINSLVKLLSLGPYDKKMRDDFYIIIAEVPHWRNAKEVLKAMEERFTPFSFAVTHLDFSTEDRSNFAFAFSLCDLAMDPGREQYLAKAITRITSLGTAKPKAPRPKTLVKKKKQRFDLNKKEKRVRPSQTKGQKRVEWEKTITGTGKRMTPQQKRMYTKYHYVPAVDPIIEAGVIVVKGENKNREVLVIRQEGQLQLPKAKKKKKDTLLTAARLGLKALTGLRLPKDANVELNDSNAISIRDFVRVNNYQQRVPRTLTLFVANLKNDEDLQIAEYDEATARVEHAIEFSTGLATYLAKLIAKFTGTFWVDRAHVEFISLSWLLDKRNKRGVEKKTRSILDTLQRDE